MEKMLRGIILSLTIVLTLHAVCSKAGLPRNASVESLIEGESAMLEPQARKIREIGSILFGIKDQFRQILEDIFNGALQTFKGFMIKTREGLLRTLDHYTFSDVLRVIFNIFTESIFEPEVYADIVEEPVVVERVEVKPVELNVYRNPYSLTSMFNH